MARSSDNDDEPDVSSLETHFVAREDDEETLWDVREIIAEKRGMYQVLWEGVNPQTNKPWPPDWVPKEDCTDPLVLAWKRKKAAKKAKKGRGRNSIRSRVSATSKTSVDSSATVTRTSVTASTKSKPVAAGMKRKRDEDFLSTSSRQSVAPENQSSAPPKKKQKVASKSPSITTRSSSSRVASSRRNGRIVDREPVWEEEESSEDEQEIISHLRQSKRIPPPSRPSAMDHFFSSDEEPPRPKTRPNDVKKGMSSNRLVVNAAGPAPKVSPQVPRTSRIHVTVTPDEAETEYEASSSRISNKPHARALKRPRPMQSDLSDDTSPPKPPRRAKSKQVHTGGKVVPVSSPPSVSPTSANNAKRAGIQKSPFVSPSSRSASPPPTSKDALPSPYCHVSSLPITQPKANDTTYAAQDTRRDDGEDSALEYVDLSVPSQPGALQTPPSAQIPRKLLLSPQLQSQPPSASPSPVPASSHSLRKSKSPQIASAQAPESQFVSETEGEESQQPRQYFNQAPPLLRSPSKNSFTSRMRPRTPGSKKNIPDPDLIASPLPFNDDGGGIPKSRPMKKLQPIPQISPTTFRGLPSSTIESVNSPPARDKHDDTIEQFESPDKSAGSRKEGKGVGTAAIGTMSQEIPDSTGESGSGNDGSLPVPPAATNVIYKGVAMADAAKKAKLNGSSIQGRVALDTIIENEKEKQRLRSVSRASDYESGEERAEKEGEEEEQQQQQRDGKIVQSTLEEFADSFVDYDAGIGQDMAISQGQTQDQDERTRTEETENVVSDEQQVKAFEKQEEEESTQDLLAELQQQQLQQLERMVPGENEGWTHPVAPLPLSPRAPRNGDEEMVDSLEVAPPKSSGPVIIDSLPDLASQPQPASQRTPDKRASHSAEQTPEIPPTISPTRPGPELLFSSSSQSQDPQLEAAMNLLNKKSEEISRLESLLATAQTTVQSLQVENVTLKSLCGAHESQVSVLTDSVQSLEAKISFAENNAEIFRRQYLEASRYASEVLAENNNLRERIEVAESQVSSGVSGIRTMFERRVQELEKEAAYHRQLATFVMEQTKRTGDEEIRKRAAEYPELEMRYHELEDKLEGAGGMIDTLERLITMKDKDIGDLRKEKREEKERMEKEMETLREEVEKLGRSGNIMNGEYPRVSTPTRTRGDMDALPFTEMETKSMAPREDVRALASPLANGRMATSPEPEMGSDPISPREDAPGDIVVYRCLWRKDGNSRCDAMFLTKEELSRHLETCGHLQ